MIKITIRITIKIVGVDGDAEAFAAEEEPKDAEFPVLEAVDLGVRTVVEIHEGAGGDQSFFAALAPGQDKGDVGDLLSDGVDGAIDPDDLLVGVVEKGAGGGRVVGGEPGRGGEGFLILVPPGAG